MALEEVSLLGKVPPNNIEAEQSTLGSMMIDRAALEKGIDILQPEDFYRDAHQLIFDALMSLAERDQPVDIVTVQEELRTRGRLDSVGGTEYLMALIDSVPTASNLEYYAHIVEEKAMLRRLLDACAQITSWSYGHVEDTSQLIDQAEGLIFKVSQKRMGQYFTPLNVLAHQTFERIEDQYSEKATISGLATGFHDLDSITSGLQSSDFIIIAARPSMGKTALSLDIARHVAIREKQPVAVFSLEMSKEQLALRMICSESRVDSHRLRTGYIRDKEWPLLTKGVDRLYTAPMFIDDSTDVSPLQMRAKCRRLKAEHGLSLIIVDYLQLIRWHRRVENRNQEISEIARSLKGLARELKVPVIALSQLSRTVERREDKKPVLSDLRESGSIEAEADVVMMLHRPEYYKHKEVVIGDDGNPMELEDDGGEGEQDLTDIIVAKQRNGPTGTVKLKFMPQFASFVNPEKHRKEYE